MRHLIVPALSALLLAGLTAHADAAAPRVLQMARNESGGEHPAQGGGTQSSPVTVPVGAVNNSGPSAGSGHGRRPHGGAMTTGGANTVGGVNTMGGTNSTGGLFTGGTGTPTGRGGRTPRGTGHGQGGAATGAGGATGVGGGHVGTSPFGTRPQNWNRFPRTFDHRTYQRNITAPRRFRWQSYHRPRGWYVRRWTFGQVLPSIFWANNYWLNDYWMFDLPIPPYGYVWVRYGDDALLVNKRTGQILQVVYGLFD